LKTRVTKGRGKFAFRAFLVYLCSRVLSHRGTIITANGSQKTIFIGPKLPKIKEKLFCPQITQIKQINFWIIVNYQLSK
jgi:hypothetical protein